jgi:PKD repeat protein
MDYKLVFIFISFLELSSCAKNNVGSSTANSNADFSFGGSSNADSVLTVGTYDQILLVNQSANANLYSWNLGNDSISHSESPVVWYTNPGTYPITLTAANSNGNKSEKTKSVKVLNRYIKSMMVTGLQNLAGTAYQINSNTKYQVELKLGANNTQYNMPSVIDSSIDAPIIYQSPLISNIDISTTAYVLTIPGNMQLNLPALRIRSLTGLGYNGIGYGLELYAIDNSGKHLLSSSYQFYLGNGSISSISIPVSDIQKNVFIAQYGNLELVCDFQ